MNYYKPDNSQPACEQFCSLLDSWRAEELSDEKNNFMQVHHDSCEACQHELQLAVQIDNISQNLPELECPPLNAVDELVRGTNKPIREPGLLAQLLATWKQPLVLVPACAALLTAVLIVSIVRTDQTEEPELIVIDGQEYTEDEVRQAVADLEMALQYIDKYSRYPQQIVTAELTTDSLPFKKRDDTEIPPI